MIIKLIIFAVAAHLLYFRVIRPLFGLPSDFELREREEQARRVPPRAKPRQEAPRQAADEGDYIDYEEIKD